MSSNNRLPRSPELMSRDDSALLVVDVQERLWPSIANAARMVWNIRRLIDGAKALGVQIAATEQYPKGLGPTVPELAQRLGEIPEKLTFSCGGCPELFERLRDAGVFKILVVGIEAHVCVQQTVLDLLAEGFRVYLGVDAVSSRHALDYEIALRRMDSAGATLTTTEAVLFEWCDAAGTPEFKQISALVREAAPKKKFERKEVQAKKHVFIVPSVQQVPGEEPVTNTPTLNPPIRTLMGPGPSDIHPRVLQAIGKNTVGHLDPYYLELMDNSQTMLRKLFGTENPMTFAVSATGSAGMEATVVNLIEPGDSMIVCVNGVFGMRMTDVAERAGASVTKVERPWGEVFIPGDLQDALVSAKPKVVGIVMAETSTGAWQPIEEIARIVHDAGAMLLVDAVTSLGGVPVEVDNWGIDAIYSGSQKCLSCPPGLAPVSFNQRAMDVILSRKTKVQSWYLDVTMLANYWGSDRVYHHTAPINMSYALYEALQVIHEEGLAACFARHALNHQALKAGLSAIGIDYAAQEGHQLPMLNAVTIPDGVDDAKTRSDLLNRFGIEIGGGLGAFKGKVWRIGLMGYGSRAANVLLFLSALEQLLAQQNYQFDHGSSIAAANAVYA